MTDFPIRIIIDDRRVPAGARRTEGALRRIRRRASEVDVALRNAFTFAFVGVGVRQLSQLADSYTNVQNRIRILTDDQNELARITDELFRISDGTRTSFDATAEVYARTALAARNLGIAQSEVLEFTESLNQAVILSGASAQEANAGLIQLSQGLSSGALRGEELRSVLEQIPVVADVIAESLGVTRGELRELGQEGQLTSDVILTAFREAREELSDRFGRTVPTLGQSFTVLNNNLIEFIGNTDRATGVSSGLASSILVVAENLDNIAGGVTVYGALFLATRANTAATGLFAAAQARLAGAFTLSTIRAQAFAAVNPFTALVVGATAAGVVLNRVAGQLVEARQELLRIEQAGADLELTEFGRIGEDIRRLESALAVAEEAVRRNGEGFETGQALVERYRTELDRLRQLQDQFASGQAASTAEAEANIVALRELAEAVTAAGDAIEEENRLLGLNSREREVQRDLAREIARIERGQDGAVTAEQAAEIEALIRRRQLLEDQAEALEDIRGPQAQFEADVAAIQALLEQGRITVDEYNAALTQLASGAEGIDFADLALDIDFEALLAELAAQPPVEVRAELTFGEFAGGILDNVSGAFARIGEESGFTANVDALSATLDNIVGPAQRLQEEQNRVNLLFEQGQITAEQYSLALADLAIQQNQIGGSAADGVAAGLARIQTQIQDVGGATEAVLVNGFNRAEDALVGFLTTGEADFSAFVDGLLADLARLLARQALGALFGGFGGGGGAGGFLAGLFGGQRQSGGPVNPDQFFLVGEEGPELFRPDRPGTIVPAGQTAALMERQAPPVFDPTIEVAPAPVTVIDDQGRVLRTMGSPEGRQRQLSNARRDRRRTRRAIR